MIKEHDCEQMVLDAKLDIERKIVECYCRGEANLQAEGRPGKYKGIVSYKGKEKNIYGEVWNATSQRMILISLLEAILLLNEPCQIHFYTHAKVSIEESIKAGQGQGANADIKDKILMEIRESKHLLYEHVGAERQDELKEFNELRIINFC
ncbi:MAG TPA: hypothetical protein GX707_14995 [Epulopiscium sp.]|nr:hypothetical protein [Candidatus Epulonipiscium sp.]